MVMYQFAVNKWVKPVIQRHKDAGRAEGRSEGRAEANQAWKSWLERKTDAENQGLSFDEPRPGSVE